MSTSLPALGASPIAACLALLLAGCAGGPTDVTGDRPDLGKATTGSFVVTSTSPSASARDTTLDVHVLGSGFDRGSNVAFLLNGIADPRVRTNSTRFVSQGDLVANVTVAIDAVPEQYDVQVTLSSGKKGIGTELFAVLSMIELDLPSGGYSYGRDVNSAGTVVGEYAVAKTTCKRAYVWTPAAGRQDLPLPTGSCLGLAAGINGAAIVGWASLGAGQHAALRWTADGSGGWAMEQLTPPAAYPSGDALAISSAGHVVGNFWMPSAPDHWVVFVSSPGTGWQQVQGTAPELWDDYGMVNAVNAAGMMVGNDRAGALFWPSPTSPPVRLPALSANAVAWDINDAGVIVGKDYIATGKRAVEWRTDRSGGWTALDLGDLGGGTAEARAINDIGQVAGASSVSISSNSTRAFLWTPGQGMQALGTLQNQSAMALAISNAGAGGPVYLSGWAVGTARGSFQRAVRWTQ